MTTPQRSFAGRFTRRGRLRNRWAEALAEPDRIRRLQLLLDLQRDFVAHSRSLATLWPPYVASVLATGGATSDELSDLEARGAVVADRSRGRLGLADAWSALISTRDARGEHDIANLRIAALYWWASLPAPARASVARQLARRGAATRNFWSVYVEHLAGARPADEPEMVAILAAAMTIGFDDHPDRIAVAGELADGLRDRGVAVPGIDLARGFAALFFVDDPDVAVAPLESAWQQDKSETALVGLVSAWLRAGAHDRIATVVAERAVPRVVGELAELSAVLRWLDDAEVAGLCPSTASRLAALNLRLQAGDWLDYAIGRAHLLEGDAPGAARILVPLADRHPNRSDWNYHAAWALLLLGDRDGVAARFDGAHSSERWPVGLLLMEADPGTAEAVQSKITADSPDPITASLVQARATLIRTGTALPVPDQQNRGSIAARLERVRGGVAAGIAAANPDDTAKWVDDRWFTRLPLADQLLWSGLAWSKNGLIEHAADGLGYARAALVLSVLTRDPSRLDRLRQRTDPTMELLRAWADPGTAPARLTALGDRAHYARGQLLLAGKDFAAAAEEFRAAATQDDDAPRDAALLWWTTAVAAGTEPAGPHPASHPDQFGRPTWLTWAAALVMTNDPTDGVPAAKHLVGVLTQAQTPPAAGIRAAAAVIANAALETTDTDRAASLTALLDELALATGNPDALRMRELAAARTARGGHTDIAVTGVPTALVIAERALAAGDTAHALRALRSVPEDDTVESRLCRQAADALAGTPAQPPEPWSPVMRLLVAAAQADEAPALAVKTLMPLLREQDLTGIVNLRNALPHLQAGVSSRRVPDYLSRLVRQVADDMDDPRATARHLAGIGDHEAADPFWRKAIDLPDDPATRGEYVAVLCHRAVLAKRQGDDMRAADHLLLAARVAASTTPRFTVIDEAEIAHLVEDTLHAPQESKRSRGAIHHALSVAQKRGDETRVLLCMERLRAYLRAGAPAESPLVMWAERLVFGWCVDRLIGDLFPADETREAAGRFSVFERAVDTDGILLFALLDQDRDGALEAWQKFLPVRGASVPLRHAVAVLFRERALADPNAVKPLVAATMLWARLLSSPKFWAGQREDVRADQDRLRTEVMRELLSEHATRGQRALTAKAANVAAPHLRCLIDCADATAVDETLDKLHLNVPAPGDPKRFADIAAVAREVLDGWIGDLLDAARKVVEDPAAIAKLKGLNGNYEGGIETLGPFLRLGVPVRPVLQTALRWYNQWCMALYGDGDLDRLAEVCQAAAKVARQLEPLCDQKKVLDPGNQTLSQHLMLRGFATRDPAKAIPLFSQALIWNPSNNNAAELLEDAKAARVNQRFEEAVDAIEAGKLDAALKVLKAIDPGGPGDDVRRGLLARVYFQRSARAVEKKDLKTARADLRRALDLSPDATWRDVIEGKLAVVELEMALRDNQWAAARNLVRKRTAAADKDHTLEMAMVLNSRAVDLANEAQQVPVKFETALREVMAAVERAVRNQNGLYSLDPDFTDITNLLLRTKRPTFGTTCAVCKGDKDLGRQVVVQLVTLQVRDRREYRVRVADFWNDHTAWLCDSCKQAWTGRKDLLARSRELLQEAVRLAPGNTTIRRNLGQVEDGL
ncbi:tetratricopeptide repeat protein [Kutzneria kofuensis]|uniref:Tetratricopeptide (TPR) repeat protein n=1 Tax=Kutzneria kofuensis TaxID=103725 RepID=A0A7W9NL46_9PSEU|nr:hypothetical protein [Kutzneria kofuensis]MBB5896660.1 tetratricopeptide (TPR) repeat protein [Kutzneria kofuensis]